MRLRDLLLFHEIEETAYAGNLGFSEMMQFMRVASKQDQEKMDLYLKIGKVRKAWELLKRVTGVPLRSMQSRFQPRKKMA